jgi:hypothetical protein
MENKSTSSKLPTALGNTVSTDKCTIIDNFKKHFSTACHAFHLATPTPKHFQSKIKSRIGFLFRNKASFTHAAKHTLVKLTILPILNFGNVIYKIASNTLICKLDAVYHSAIRFVTKATYTTHHCNLYALFVWSSLHIRRQTHWLQVIYKSLLGIDLPHLSSLVTKAIHAPAGIISFPKPTPALAAFPSNDWKELQNSLKLETYISLTNFKR